MPDDWEHYDRSFMMDNYDSNSPEERRESRLLKEEAKRKDYITSNVIEKSVIESANGEISNHKSNIQVHFSNTMRDWVTRVPKEPKREPSVVAMPLTPEEKTSGTEEPRRDSRTISFGNLEIDEKDEDDGDEEDDEMITDSKRKSTTTIEYSKGKSKSERRRKSDIIIKAKRSSRRSITNSILSSISSIHSSISSIGSKRKELYTTLSCSICLDNYKAGDKIYWSPNEKCTHSFHAKCMTDWLLKNDLCPICRNNYLDDECVTAP